MTPMSFHGALLRRIGSCNINYGSSLDCVFCIPTGFTASRCLDDISTYWGFIYLLCRPEILRCQQFCCWIDFPCLCLGFLCVVFTGSVASSVISIFTPGVLLSNSKSKSKYKFSTHGVLIYVSSTPGVYIPSSLSPTHEIVISMHVYIQVMVSELT